MCKDSSLTVNSFLNKSSLCLILRLIIVWLRFLEQFRNKREKKIGWGGMGSTLGSRASRLKNNAMRVKLKEMPKCSAFDLNEAWLHQLHHESLFNTTLAEYIYYCFYENPIRLSYTFRKIMDERLTCKAHPLLKDDSERGSYKTKSLIPALEMKHELFVRNNIPNEKCTCSTHSSCLCSDGKYRIFANFTLSFHPNIARPSLLSSFQLFKGKLWPMQL